MQTGVTGYTYGNPYWADMLTAVTVDGTSKTISYSSYGNPLSWYNGTEYTNLTWTQGRRLSSLKKGTADYSFTYDMSGVRTSKIADGKKHEYVTQNGRVVRETVTGYPSGTFQYMLDFTYDESGNPLTMRKYNNEALTSYATLHYICNAQGDVVKLVYGSSNTVYATYTYDAWGRVLTATGSYANINPLRYRGYYYDAETGFYYLQSRYYDPTLGRFINADSYASTGQGFLGYNMFAYCGNNPASHEDSQGGRMQNVLMADGGGLQLSSKEKNNIIASGKESEKYLKELNSYDGIGLTKPSGAKVCKVTVTKGTYEITKGQIRLMSFRKMVLKQLFTFGTAILHAGASFAYECVECFAVDEYGITIVPRKHEAYFVTLEYDLDESVSGGPYHVIENRVYVILSYSNGDKTTRIMESDIICYLK